MSKILGYIGLTPCNEFLSDCIENIKENRNDKTGISITDDEKIRIFESLDKLDLKEEIKTLIMKSDGSPKASENLIACCQSAQTNEENISLPFNIFKNPDSIDDIMLSICEYLKSSTKGEIIKSTNKALVGDLTFVFYDKKEDALYCQMGASPLVIGVGTGFGVVANDISTIYNCTHKIIPLESGDKAKITRDKITIFNSKNHRIKKSVLKLNENIEKSNDFYLIEELFTLSSSVSTLLSSTIKDGKFNFKQLKLNKLNAKAYSNIIIISDVEDYYSALCASKIIGVILSVSVEVHLAQEYIRENKNFDSSSLVIALNLSGEDISLNECVSYMNSQKIKCIAICSSAYSYLARQCEYKIITPTSDYDLVNNISLNAFITGYLSICLFALYFANLTGSISDVYTDVSIKMAQMLPGKIAQSAKKLACFDKISDTLKNTSNIIFTGCGIDYPICKSMSKAHSKINKTNVSCYNIFELSEIYKDRSNVIIGIITNKDYLCEFKESLKKARLEGASVIIVTNCNIEQNLKDFDNIIIVNDSLPIYNIIMASVGLYSLSIYCDELNRQNDNSKAI